MRYDPRTPIERFREKVNILPSGCWEWQASRDNNGYGQFSYNGKNHKASRWIYSVLVDDISEKEEVHHLCENRPCVNPSHLVALTQSKHSKFTWIAIKKFHKKSFSWNANKTHCSNGHPFNEKNTYIYVYKGSTFRQCLRCKVAYNRRRRKSLKTQSPAR